MVEDRVIDEIIMNSEDQLKWVKKFKKKRYLYDELLKINKEYYIGIKGVRGIGKTVLLLQIAQKNKNAVYFSADSAMLKNNSIYEVVKELIKRDIKNIFIDEIHRKINWDVDIKSLYDEHKVRVFFTGSSALDITKTGADLSRRVVLKELLPASFREFLNIKKGFDIPVLKLKNILDDKSLVNKYLEAFNFFDEYLKYGGMLYPKSGFFEAVGNSLRKVILSDLITLREINIKYESDIYKLLYFVSKSEPFEINYSRIANHLDISKNFAIRMVDDLKRAGILIVIFAEKKKGELRKEPKIYLTLPLREFLNKGERGLKGASREEFFVNHLRDVRYLKGKRGEKTPDFKYKKIIIEIGGESKKKNQNADYIAIDGLSNAGNKVPLFLFGFIY
ncbi:MAG: AAA family ATPase [Nanoarchaeota archaeon]|nr:AAA family ATPase [Nanoarchaeota archaeon]